MLMYQIDSFCPEIRFSMFSYLYLVVFIMPGGSKFYTFTFLFDNRNVFLVHWDLANHWCNRAPTREKLFVGPMMVLNYLSCIGFSCPLPNFLNKEPLDASGTANSGD